MQSQASRRTFLAVLAASLVLIAAACGGEDATAETTTTTRATTTTTRATTTTTRATTTTIDDSIRSPLTGLPVDDASLLDRRAVVVKIDNHPSARPQSGLPHADMLLELPVEGITRLVAVFHSEDVAEVGPVRSIRPTDWQVAALFDGPIVISGGQNWVVSQNVDHGADIIGEVGVPVTRRVAFRSAPHDLYADTGAARDLADDRGYDDDPPEALWQFGDLPRAAERATEIRLHFSNSLVADWSWDGTAYTRMTNGVGHEWVDNAGVSSQIEVDVLVVLSMDTYLASPPAGGGPARAVESVGSGDAWIFAGGRVVEGRWSRPDADSGFELTTGEGEPMPVPPGRAWVSFFPRGEVPDW